MNKPLVVISAPVDTFSGYGARSRDIALSIIKSGKYDVKIISQRWGATPWGFLKPDNKEHKLILDCVLPQPQLPRQPECWIQITVPNEFQPIGKYNIGITAGIETTICDPSWIEGCNRMNLVLVSSNHAKETFKNSKFEKRDQNTKALVEAIELKTPMEVLFEGVNTEIYNNIPGSIVTDVNDLMNDVKENFCFLFVGHWLPGTLGEDRKDVGMMIKTFIETFKDKANKPALVLKLSGGTYSILDREDMLDKINRIRSEFKGKLPPIYLLHGELTDEEMNELYNHRKIKAMISFTKGEGFGRPLLEFTLSQKPVIASNWSGHKDFLKHALLLSGEIKQIHPTAVQQNMLIPESSWFTVNYNEASKVLENVYKNYNKTLDDAKKQSYISRTEFSLNKMSDILLGILEEKLPKQVELKLPQIKKIELPKLKKI